MHTYEGTLSAAGHSYGVIVSRTNSLVTRPLLDGALDCLRRHGAADKDITLVWSPGAFEIPPIALRLATAGTVDAIICLGAVIKGETPHFDYIAAEVAKGIAGVGMQTGIPVAFGVLTTENLEQALERAGAKAGNKGWDAAMTAIELINLNRQLPGRKKA